MSQGGSPSVIKRGSYVKSMLTGGEYLSTCRHPERQLVFWTGSYVSATHPTSGGTVQCSGGGTVTTHLATLHMLPVVVLPGVKQRLQSGWLLGVGGLS